MCLVSVLLLMGSGALLLFSYQPFPEFAYTSVLSLEDRFVFGPLTRSVHYFSANLLVILVFLHMLRVYFTGGYQGKRRMNWMIGLCILCFVLMSCFTGYLLPWDQTAFWAITICINMFDYIPAGDVFKGLLGDHNGVSEKTLQLFFTLHTTLIPGALLFFLGIHFWKIRKAKGVITSRGNPGKNDNTTVMVATTPNLLLREAVAALVFIACILTLSFFLNAPLGDMANAGMSPNPAKAPWYFSGFQELLLHFHPFFAVFFIPLTIAGILVYLPFKKRDIHQNEGTWFISVRAKNAAIASVLFSCILTPGGILFDEYLFDFQNYLPDIPIIVSTGLIPFALVPALVLCFHYAMKQKLRLNHAEAFQTTSVFLITAFILLTLTCTFFRGAGMKLFSGSA